MKFKLIALSAFAGWSMRAAAQGCASCYTTAAAGGPQTAHALRVGILVLVVPPVLLFASIVVFVGNWRKESRHAENSGRNLSLKDNKGPSLLPELFIMRQSGSGRPPAGVQGRQ